jgi:hypothetical protein
MGSSHALDHPGRSDQIPLCETFDILAESLG